MRFDDLLKLEVSTALARIQVNIEWSAYDALTLMGSDAATLGQSLSLIRHAEKTRESREVELKEAHLQYDECINSGIEPFNAEKWKQACRDSAMALGAGPLIYKGRHQLDYWFGECIDLMPAEFKLEGRHIFHSVRAEALGIQPFNPELFEKSCSAASEEAADGCGQSDVLWAQRATNAIGSLLTQIDKESIAEAKVIGRYQGWMDDEECKTMSDMIDNMGLCSHGIDPDYCPVGCGDRS